MQSIFHSCRVQLNGLLVRCIDRIDHNRLEKRRYAKNVITLVRFLTCKGFLFHNKFQQDVLEKTSTIPIQFLNPLNQGNLLRNIDK